IPRPGPRPPGLRAYAHKGDDPAITGEPPEERAPGLASNVPRLSRTGRVRPDTAANERPASRFRCPSKGAAKTAVTRANGVVPRAHEVVRIVPVCVLRRGSPGRTRMTK